MNYLTPDDIDCFNQEGYLIFEGLLDHDLNERLKAGVDQLMVDRQKGERPILMTYPELGLCTYRCCILPLGICYDFFLAWCYCGG